MDLNWLDDVLVLLEERNMTRAADRRNITQPAFSRRIRSFENWLGSPILERHSNRIEISEALTSNEGEIRGLAARLREMRTEIANFDAARTTVTIAGQHAAVFSTFPDMALRTKATFPSLNFRLRAGNLHDCVTMFLRGDTSMLLCYEAERARPLELGRWVQRGYWGSDYLVPVVGGGLRYAVRGDGKIEEDTPAVVYPENSFFGEVLSSGERLFGTPGLTTNPACVTAFSNGVLELVLRGIGVGWVPFSMAHNGLQSGDLISLANQFGKEPLKVVVFADRKIEAAVALLNFWENGAGATEIDRAIDAPGT